MKRILENEIMTTYAQAKAYAGIDFDFEHDYYIRELDRLTYGRNIKSILDIGCGPGVLSCKLSNHFNADVLAIDGSESMIDYAKDNFGGNSSVEFQQILLPGYIPVRTFDLIFCANFLHHLHYPEVLWNTLRTVAQRSTFIFIVDLCRPSSVVEANLIVQRYAKNSPKIMQEDFYNSLLASFTAEEIQDQLKILQINGLSIEKDKYLKIFGNIL
jgi:2-polyprenyl-3-methyl-5-hydroxy-6-metoxy-1,4-benzoquinol methylase